MVKILERVEIIDLFQRGFMSLPRLIIIIIYNQLVWEPKPFKEKEKDLVEVHQ